MDTRRLQLLAVRAQDIAPLERPERRELIAVEQPIHNHRAAVGIRDIGDQGLRFVRRGKTSRQVERHAAKELVIGANVRRQDLKLLELLENSAVHEVQLGGIVPRKAGDIFEERQVGGRHPGEIACEDGGLTASVLCHQALHVDRTDRFVGGTEVGECGHISNRSVAEVAQHHDLLARGGLTEDSLRRHGFDLHEIGFGWLAEPQSLPDPLFENPVSGVTLLEPLATTVCHFHQWLA